MVGLYDNGKLYLNKVCLDKQYYLNHIFYHYLPKIVILYQVELKRIVKLLSGYPDPNSYI